MIHSSSIISDKATIGRNVTIGPFCIIGDDVTIGDNCVLNSHVVIKGVTTIGENNTFFQFCSIGEDCQDKKYAGEKTFLIIGNNNVFREFVSVHRGTIQDNSTTQIGNGNLFMASAHIAHDCIVGNDNIFANNATLAGHVHIANNVIMGGLSAIHQFCKVGSNAFMGGGAIILKDIPPYVMISGTKHIPQGINSEGLKRKGYASDSISAVKKAYKIIYRNGNTVEQALVELTLLAKEYEVVKPMVDFIKGSSRGIVR